MSINKVITSMTELSDPSSYRPSVVGLKSSLNETYTFWFCIYVYVCVNGILFLMMQKRRSYGRKVVKCSVLFYSSVH